MPFAQADFERDLCPPEALEPESLQRFRDLLEAANSGGRLRRFELDGSRDHRPEAYEAAGQVILNQSDLLVVVWDGGVANGQGGTFETLHRAMASHVPVVWIDAKAPHGWMLLLATEDLERIEDHAQCSPPPTDDDPAADRKRLRAAIVALVEDELSLPNVEGLAENRPHLAAFLSEHKPRLNLAFAWKLFRDLLDRGSLRMPGLIVHDYVDQIKSSWPSHADGRPREGLSSPSASTSWINDILRAHYAWSDKLADRYADAHRSAFIWQSLLAATAVFLAVLPMAASWKPHRDASLAVAVIEAVVLIMMLGIPSFAKRRSWHLKWTEYRVLAELIRELRILIPLGGGRPRSRTAAHLADYGDPAQTWMYWQVRAIARATDLPNAKVDADYLGGQIDYLLDFLGSPEGGRGQIGFHHMSSERYERIHARLHEFALTAVSLTIIGVALNWLLPLILGAREPEGFGRWLILISAFFPALTAALASINNQGEFARLRRRSYAMAENFKALKRKVVELQLSGRVTLTGLNDLAGRFAAMMVDENTDWRIVVLDLPHAAG